MMSSSTFSTFIWWIPCILLALLVGGCKSTETTVQEAQASTPVQTASKPSNTKPKNTPSPSAWTVVNEKSIAKTGDKLANPNQFQTYRLNWDILRKDLGLDQETPPKLSATSFPLPWLPQEKFLLTYVPMISQKMQKEMGEYHSWNGRGFIKRTTNVRMEMPPKKGIYAIITGPTETMLLHQYQQGDKDHYMLYYKWDEEE